MVGQEILRVPAQFLHPLLSLPAACRVTHSGSHCSTIQKVSKYMGSILPGF